MLFSSPVIEQDAYTLLLRRIPHMGMPDIIIAWWSNTSRGVSVKTESD